MILANDSITMTKSQKFGVDLHFTRFYPHSFFFHSMIDKIEKS